MSKNKNWILCDSYFPGTSLICLLQLFEDVLKRLKLQIIIVFFCMQKKKMKHFLNEKYPVGKILYTFLK